MQLIGIMGQMGTGKSTVAEILKLQYGYSRTKFSSTLKKMMLQIPGVTMEMLEDPELKSMPNVHLGGRTPRHAMQTLGTEWGRNIMFDYIWLHCWQRSLGHLERVTVEDVRFENEIKLIKELGGQVWHITRAGMRNNDVHSSEAEVLLSKPDVVIENSGTKGELLKKIAELMNDNNWDGGDIHPAYKLEPRE